MCSAIQARYVIDSLTNEEEAMATLAEVMQELKARGTEQTVKTMGRHGGPTDKMYGVKIADMKIILKKIKGDQKLALQLYDTGNSDAMYLAGLLADGSKMTAKQLNDWAKKAPWYMISDYTVAWVASENPDGFDLACKWIESRQELVASAGWSTLAAIAGTREDSQLDLESYLALLGQVENSIHQAKNRVKYSMNNFVISVACFIRSLHKQAMATAKRIGKVEVDVGDTSCQVPVAVDYITKTIAKRGVGTKRSSPKC